MISKICLQFVDSKTRSRYSKQKQRFYSKAIPIVASMMFALSMIVEVLYRFLKVGNDLSIVTSCINWSFCGILVVLSILIRYVPCISWIVLPILSSLTYYYFGFIDYDNTTLDLYFRYSLFLFLELNLINFIE